MVGMQDRREQHYPTLSGGEQQKVQLARVLAQIWSVDDTGDHKYLFLDEPTANLDVHYQIHLLDVARDLLAHDCTIVAILHDLNVAFHYGDAFFLMDGGRVAKEADHSLELTKDLIERVFRVTAHRLSDPESREDFWKFTI
jgi:iron complex transport system ATP-binding protein